MGLFTKSLVILLIALSTPLLYRQFANDNTVKFISSYYSNYKSIDQFLKQSANHLDRVKDYLPNSNQLEGVVDKLNQHVNNLIVSTTKTVDDIQSKKDVPKKKDVEKEEKKAKKPSIKLSQCSDEDLNGKQIRLWSKQELAKYDGKSDESDIYLGFLGLVYNVTTNMQHYASGADYNAFAGCDATRAFVTGNLTHDLHDDINDIDESLYSHIKSWASFYNTSYPILGRLEGKYFDSRGCATLELVRVHDAINKVEQNKANNREQETDFPECNSEWNSDLKKGRVWCSKKSGGIDRDWVGVPRIYNNGESQRCACFNQDRLEVAELEKLISVYPGCDPEATECLLKQ